MPPVGVRTVFVEEINSEGHPVQKFGRTNTYTNKVVHTVGVSQNSENYSVVQMIQNGDGNLYKREFVLPEGEIMKLMSLPDTLVPIEGIVENDNKPVRKRKKPVAKKTAKGKKAAKKTVKKAAKKTATKKTAKTAKGKTAKKTAKKTSRKK